MSQSSESYIFLKQQILDCYFDFSRDRGFRLRWPREDIFGAILYEFEAIAQNPLNNLMINCVILSLAFDLPNIAQQSESLLRNLCDKDKVINEIENLLKEDQDLLRNDLNILLGDFGGGFKTEVQQPRK